jgi:hypothetical protein
LLGRNEGFPIAPGHRPDFNHPVNVAGDPSVLPAVLPGKAASLSVAFLTAAHSPGARRPKAVSSLMATKTGPDLAITSWLKDELYQQYQARRAMEIDPLEALRSD